MNKDLPLEAIEAIRDYYFSELTELKDRYTETNWRLTQHNFLTNAGGAIAVLGYMGSVGTASFAIWPLIFFVAGILTSGLGIRALQSAYSGLHKKLYMTIRCGCDHWCFVIRGRTQWRIISWAVEGRAKTPL